MLSRDGVKTAEMLMLKEKEIKEKMPNMSQKEASELAYSETVAECCETMLTNTDAWERIAQRLSREKSLVAKIKEFFEKAVESLKEIVGIYSDAKDHRNAEIAKDTLARAETLRNLFADAGADAIKNYNAASKSEQKNNTQEGAKHSLREIDVDEFTKETKNNISLRGGIILNSLGDLKHHIKTALYTDEKANMYLGGVPNDVKSKIENDVGQKIFKDKQYSFVVSYDDVRHIKEHFGNDTAKISEEVIKLYDIIKNYDNVSLETTDKGLKKLIFNKSYSDYDYRTVEIASNKKATLDLVTLFITKNNIKSRNKQSVPSANNGLQRGSVTPANTNLSQKDKSVNSSISENSKNDTKSQEKFSTRDSEGRELSKAQQEYFKDSKVRDENGNLLVVYHGTVNKFTVFDRKFGNVEGDWGKGFYFTNEYDDVEQNYASEEGPDLRNKISRYAERIENDYDDFDEALEAAREHYITAEPNVIEAYLNLMNPVFVGENETFFDYNEDYDDETDEYSEPEGLLVDFVEALGNNIDNFEYYGNIDFWNALGDGIYDGGMNISDIVKSLNDNLLDEVLDENGDIAVKELIRLSLEDMGFDGIIDTTVSNKFKTMSGMYDTTKHYIAFSSNQAKNTDNLNPTENEDIRYSERYSYESLVKKSDMAVTVLDKNTPKNRADVVYEAKKNAAKIGKRKSDGSVSVYVKDIDTDVVLSTDGLKHSLDRRFNDNAPITLKAGDIISNSIRINELVPVKNEAESAYILIGYAESKEGTGYIVRSVVNKFSSNLISMDVLYAINAKKDTAVLNAPRVSTPSYRIDISISDLLDYVNRYFPDILPESVLKHYGHEARPEGKLGENALYSERDTGYKAALAHLTDEYLSGYSGKERKKIKSKMNDLAALDEFYRT